MRIFTAVLAVLCLLVSGSAPWRVIGVGATGTGTSSAAALRSYVQGTSQALNILARANTHVVTAGTDLTRNDYRAASADLGKAVAGEKRAKTHLDALTVPAHATRVQTLLDRALGTFVVGARTMQQGAEQRDSARVKAGAAIYYRAAAMLARAYPLMLHLTA